MLHHSKMSDFFRLELPQRILVGADKSALGAASARGNQCNPIEMGQSRNPLQILQRKKQFPPAMTCQCHEVICDPNDLIVEIVHHCASCEVNFRQLACFMQHCQNNPRCMVFNNSNTFFCNPCRVTISDLENLGHHLKEHLRLKTHDTLRILCSICKIEFPDILKPMDQHWSRHEKKKFFCSTDSSIVKLPSPGRETILCSKGVIKEPFMIYTGKPPTSSR